MFCFENINKYNPNCPKYLNDLIYSMIDLVSFRRPTIKEVSKILKNNTSSEVKQSFYSKFTNLLSQNISNIIAKTTKFLNQPILSKEKDGYWIDSGTPIFKKY